MPSPSPIRDRHPLARPLLALVCIVGCASPASTSPVVEFGGGTAITTTASACPSEFPVRRVVGDVTICADPLADVTAVTRTECREASIDCETLYGCFSTELAGCDATVTTADCGGEGPVTLGCEESFFGRCRWFTGGCLPNGFVASECPVDDLCCVPGEHGEVTYASSPLAAAAEDFLTSYGRAAIALDQSFELGVVEGEPADFAGLAVTCPDSNSGLFFCEFPAPLDSWGADGTWGVTATPAGVFGFGIEVRTTATGLVRGRVCRYEHPDYGSGLCGGFGSPGLRCATDGTITLGASGARAAFELQGESWVIDFVP